MKDKARQYKVLSLKNISFLLRIYIRGFLRHTELMFFSKSRKSPDKKGFSLVEVLAALLIFSALISIVVQISYGNSRRLNQARQLEKIASLLELKMRELEEEFSLEKVIQLAREDEGEFLNEEGYFWTYQTQPLPLPSTEIVLSLIKLPNTEINRQMIQIFRDVLTQTVIEMKLTVYYEGKGKKRFQSSLVSYFVNYEDAPDFIISQMSQFIPGGISP